MGSLRSLLACLVLLLAAPFALADGLIIIDPRPDVLVPRGHPRFAPLEVTQHHVTVEIKGQVAVTSVDQTFRNPGDARLEGTYIFPLPPGGHIDKFSMDVNGKMVEAELLDADKARAIYEGIVRKARDPALLEYVGKGMFRARIFPIEPRSNKRVQIKYTQLLASDANLASYTYPLNTEKFSAAPLKEVSVKVTLETKRPIKSIYSPSHSVEIKRDGDHKAVVGYEASNVKPDTDFVLHFSTQRDKAGDIDLSLLTYSDTEGVTSGGGSAGAGGYFLLLASAPWNPKDEQVLKKDVVFVLDTSGSMAGEKMEQARRALRFCVANLNDGDRFQIVRFSTEAEKLFEGMAEADKAHRDQAEEFIKGLKPVGGTAIEDALVMAAETVRKRADGDRPCVVIFMTDGRPTIGDTDEDQILKSLTKAIGDASVRVFCFGIGTDINTHLLDKITQETRAVSQYVLPSEDIEVKVSAFYSKISNPVLANPKLEFKNVRVTGVYPSTLPDLFQGDQLVVVGRYEKPGDAAIVLSGGGAAAGKARTVTFEGTFPEKSSDHAYIPRLWATRRVGYLLDQVRLHGENAELKDEVTQLARRYGIVTPYTAYLIVEDEDRRNIDRLSRVMPGEASRPLSETREELEGAARDFRMSKSGNSAIESARETESLKHADAPGAPAASGPGDARGGSARRDRAPFGAATEIGGVTGATPSDGEGRAQQVPQSSKFVRGRTFYLNGAAWIDSQIASAKDPKREKVTFGSDAYFALLKKHADMPAWLSVGEQVQVLFDGVIYEVVTE